MLARLKQHWRRWRTKRLAIAIDLEIRVQRVRMLLINRAVQK